MRHAVNKSVDAGIKAKPESFAALKKEMASPSFKEELEKARDNPKSREAGKLIQRLIANDIHMYDGRENTLEP